MSIYCFYRSRCRRKRRCDTGLLKINIKNPVAKYKRVTEQEVRDEVRKAKVTREVVDKLGETTTWSSEQVAKEADFQAKKFRGKLLDEAIKPNSLLTEAELQHVGSGTSKTQRKLD